MALIVEDGTGRADAESYASVSDATTYHTARGRAASWAAVTDQEAALRLATAYMEQAYRLRWKSFRVTSTQALCWPRAWVQTPDAPYGYGSFAAYIPNNVIPTEVKQACMELALKTVSGELAPDLDRTTLTEKIGPIEVQYDKDALAYTRYRSIDLLLGPLLLSGGASVPLVRA